MTEERLIIQMGQGLDAGGNPQAAAERAVLAAQTHAVLAQQGQGDGRWILHLGAPDPATIDAEPLQALVPGGLATVQIRAGGLVAEGAVVVTAALELFVPV